MALRTLEAVDLTEIAHPVPNADALLGATGNAVLDLRPATRVALAPPDFGEPADVAGLGLDETPFSYEVVSGIGRADPFRIAKLFGAQLRNGCHTLMTRPGIAVGESYHKRAFYLAMKDAPHPFVPLRVPLMYNGRETRFVARIYDDETPDQVIDGPVLVIASRWDSNYYHWLIDCLPRLACLDHVGALREMPVLVPDALSGFHADSLAALGITRTVPFSGRVLRAGTMYFPTFFAPGMLTAEQLAWIKDALVRGLGVERDTRADRRLLISRQSAGDRRIVNEAEVMARLAGLGFEMVRPEALTLREQAALFARAEIVVAPHGAGTVNAMFCREGAAIIDILPETHQHPAFWLLARANRMRYGRMLAKLANPPPSLDMVVDVGRLENLVRQALGTRHARQAT